ncbi:MAG: hypothetical protein LBG77_00250 [Dysgonamonadaceae bacterium]|jgi:hypothetical protein|nr:hypothetical protein [Dysgonamonadaceae bacterium]
MTKKIKLEPLVPADKQADANPQSTPTTTTPEKAIEPACPVAETQPVSVSNGNSRLRVSLKKMVETGIPENSQTPIGGKEIYQFMAEKNKKIVNLVNEFQLKLAD